MRIRVSQLRSLIEQDIVLDEAFDIPYAKKKPVNRRDLEREMQDTLPAALNPFIFRMLMKYGLRPDGGRAIVHDDGDSLSIRARIDIRK